MGYARVSGYYEEGKPKVKILQENYSAHKATYSRFEEISRVILMAVNLIKLLERDGYIMLLQDLSKKPSNVTFGSGAANQPYEQFDINDDDVAKLLMDYSFIRIYVTEEFRVFCANGYIPRADVQFNQNLKLTKQSLELTKQSLELTNQGLELTNQNLELTNQSIELSKQSLELTRQSLKKARISNYIAIATLIITSLFNLVMIAISLGWRPSFFS